MDALVEARAVEMTFASGPRGRRVNIHVLRKISFDVGHGETLGLVGEFWFRKIHHRTYRRRLA